MALPTRILAVAAAGSLAFTTGCGDSGSSADDEKDIAAAAKTGFTTKDLKVKCEEIISESFLREVYGTVAQCRKAEAPDPDDKPTTDVTTSDIKVEGDTATAKVVLKGGSSDGATGALALRKEDGSWRVNDLGADLLRSTLETEVGNDNSAEFSDPAIKSCAVKSFAKLSDDELQSLAYGAIGERAGADENLGKVIIPCLTESGTDGGTSFLRKKFEEGIESSAKKDGTPQKVVDCVKAELRKSITDKEIGELAQQGGKSSAGLTQRVAKAITTCQEDAS